MVLTNLVDILTKMENTGSGQMRLTICIESVQNASSNNTTTIRYLKLISKYDLLFRDSWGYFLCYFCRWMVMELVMKILLTMMDWRNLSMYVWPMISHFSWDCTIYFRLIEIGLKHMGLSRRNCRVWRNILRKKCSSSVLVSYGAQRRLILLHLLKMLLIITHLLNSGRFPL